MKKSTKRFCLKLAAGFLSTTIIASLASPMNVLATSNASATDNTDVLLENVTIDSSSTNYSENIIREIEEERDEFSKTFLLTDGTYYTYVSPVAIHEFVEDKWIEIDESLRETPATISDAEETVKDFVKGVETTSSQVSTYSFSEPNTSLSVTCVGGATQTETGYNLPANGALVIRPETITKFSMANKALLSATLSVNIDNNVFNPTVAMYLKSLASEVTSSTPYSEINNCSNIYYKMYSNSTAAYNFDITDIYSKWERGLLANNGIAIIAPAVSVFPLSFSSMPVLSLKYKNVSANDSSFTYHTLDLGKAGILSINDVTNAFKLEQPIAGLDCSLLPVALTKTIDSANFSLNSYANVSSAWNYEYSLAINGSYATATLPQGTIIDFVQTANVTNEGYQVWEKCQHSDYVNTATLYVTQTAAEAGGVGNTYEGCYFDIDGIKYVFNNFGRLDYIEKADKVLDISYAYSNEADKLLINALTDADGNKYCITYSLYTINNKKYPYASKIEVKDASDNAITFAGTNLITTITNTVIDSTIVSTYSYYDGSTSSYTYDLTGKLLKITGTDGVETELQYKSNDNLYLTGYTQTKNDTVINEFTISSDNTYERIFEGTLIETEIQRYDSEFQLVAYHYGTNIISMSYKDGVIDSYAIDNNGNIENKVINGDFSTNPYNDGYWFPVSTAWPEYNINQKNERFMNDSAEAVIGIKQYVQGLEADKTYVFSAETLVERSIPSNDYSFTANITLFNESGITLKNIDLPFDVTLLNETQTRMCAFKTDVNCIAMISICANGNVGSFVVDNVRLYEATSEDGSVAIPTISTSNPIVQTEMENGVVTKETISDGQQKLVQEYFYNSDYTKLLESIDFNNVSTHFDYSGKTGKLTEKGYTLNGESIANPLEYSYKSAELLDRVERAIDSTTDTNYYAFAQYSYDPASRVESLTNNGYRYLFTYNDIGNITKIQKQSVTEESSTTDLVNYNYNNQNIGTIEYSNGYKLEYLYDTITNKISKISCYKLDEGTPINIGSYSYTYENNEIKETILSFSDLSYDIKISKTATGHNIYYVSDDVETLVYTKYKSSTSTVEEYISSVSGNDLYETFTRTDVVETVNGNNTELYSTFTGSKDSVIDNATLTYEGTNNTVKDYFGRATSKHFTLETVTSNNATQSDLLSLTQNYSYHDFGIDLEDGLIRTSNLIESATNEYTLSRTINNTTTTDIEMDLSYYYIYDDLGNIKFSYMRYPDGTYHLESCYQYDEANQVVAVLSADDVATYDSGYNFVSYTYDAIGNVTKKTFDGNITISNINSALTSEFYVSDESVWNTFDWEDLKNITFSNTNPTREITYTYKALGQLDRYIETAYTYEDNGDIATTTVVHNIEVGYDAYGNPSTHIGESPLNGTVIADLFWNGNLLESAIVYDGETPEKKITFKYDENGFRINKTIYEYNSSSTPRETQHINYIWEDGTLTGMQIINTGENNTKEYFYTNILYDNTGTPYGITSPTGSAYYFLRDGSDSVRGLIGPDGELIAFAQYDAFGNVQMAFMGDSILDRAYSKVTALYNPCTYKGYLFDYELGMYFIQNKCYSPAFGRFLSEDSVETLTEPKDNPLDTNLHLFCNNNPVNSSDVNAEWNRDKFTFSGDKAYDVKVEMSKAFLSRPFCTLFASKILNETGSWDYINGRCYNEMDVERIASNLFARCVGNYAESAVNRVNATWGDGWIVNNRNSGTIIITENDINADKYLKIWQAAPSIKIYAALKGIYITL